MTDTNAKRLFDCLIKHKLTLATAESCTGGLAAKLITDISGSSSVFLGSVISYSNKIKTDILKVSEKTIAEEGAVSLKCALEMAKGIYKLTGADISISTTGIAGPTGAVPATDGKEAKPVGLVYVGIHFKNKTRVYKLRFTGDRETIRHKTVAFAFNKAVEIIENNK